MRTHWLWLMRRTKSECHMWVALWGSTTFETFLSAILFFFFAKFLLLYVVFFPMFVYFYICFFNLAPMSVSAIFCGYLCTVLRVMVAIGLIIINQIILLKLNPKFFAASFARILAECSFVIYRDFCFEAENHLLNWSVADLARLKLIFRYILNSYHFLYFFQFSFTNRYSSRRRTHIFRSFIRLQKYTCVAQHLPATYVYALKLPHILRVYIHVCLLATFACDNNFPCCNTATLQQCTADAATLYTPVPHCVACHCNCDSVVTYLPHSR